MSTNLRRKSRGNSNTTARWLKI